MTRNKLIYWFLEHWKASFEVLTIYKNVSISLSFFTWCQQPTDTYRSVKRLTSFTLAQFLTHPMSLIGVYMPPFGLMVGSLLLQAVALYLSGKEEPETEGWNFVKLLPMLLLALVSGLIFHSAPEYLALINRFMNLKLSTEDAIFGGFCILTIIHWIVFSNLGQRYNPIL